MNDGGKITRVQALLDELARGRLHSATALWGRMQIVEKQYVQTALEAMQIGTDVHGRRCRGSRAHVGSLDRDLDEGHAVDRLRLAVLEDPELVAAHVANEASLAV